MSTRSKARTAASNRGGSTPSRTKAKTTNNTTGPDSMDVDAEATDKKENGKVASKASTSNSKKKLMPHKVLESFCTCDKGDDGSPMILCSECNIWYHFSCVKLDEDEAGDIDVYICPSCAIYSGRHSTMTWEGSIALEDDEAAVPSNAIRQKSESRTSGKRTPARILSLEESEESSSSEDEYVDEKEQQREDNRQSRSRQTSVASEAPARQRSSRVKSSSPTPSTHGHLKRKASNAVGAKSSTPPPRKKRAGTSNQPTEDPARKYCLGKLDELFKDVFLRYPHVKMQPKAEEMDIGEDNQSVRPTLVSKKLEELSDEEKEALIEESRQFAKDLEQCVFEIYSEPDKNGHPHAGGKYKERFRMLQFNLSKPDRVMIHQRITSGNIAPKEISLMSSNDLADEETKESIKLAEKEALEHSILLKSAAPRAKITHKGLQDIEDVNGDIATAHEIEVHLDREQVEEERRERERMARLRTTQRQRTASISVPPESPSSQQGSGEALWGAPPPVPAHAMSPTAPDFAGKMLRPQLSMQTSFDMAMEPDIDLSDFINMDGDQEPISAVSSDDKNQTSMGPSFGMSPVGVAPTGIPPASPIGISPFASQAERQRAPSFDLNSLWTASAPKDELTLTEAVGATATPVDTHTESPIPFVDESPDDSDKDDAMDLESNEANDQDFDMFLDKEPEDEGLIIKPIDNEAADDELIVTPLPPKNVEGLPAVWTGKVTMPLDSLVPQETTLIARQIAGRPLAADSPLWQTLFPTNVLRIEGRVPVENAIKYLMQMRFNSTKELYAATFAPSSSEGRTDFDAFCSFLITKSRHGLVFPWGQRPKDYHPGRELYMVPLPQSERLPEFVEVLDDLKLPKIRDKDYLLGIWILNKGKLAVLPTVPSASTATSVSPPVPPFQGQSPTSRTPSLSMPSFQSPLHMPPQPSQSVPPPTISGLSAIAPDALAAEVASLTGEQIQALLKTLSATTAVHLQPGGPPMPPVLPVPSLPPQSALRPPGAPGHNPTPPMGQHMMPPTPPGAPQPWMHGTPPPGPPVGPPYGNYPPQNIPFQQPPLPGAPPQMGGRPMPPGPSGPYGRAEYDAHAPQDYGRGQPPDYDSRGPGSRGYDRDFRGGGPGGGAHYGQGGAGGGGGGGEYGGRGGGGQERGWRGGAGNHRGGQSQRGGGRGDFRGRGRGGGGFGPGGARDAQDLGDRRPTSDAGWQSRRPRNDSKGGPQW